MTTRRRQNGFSLIELLIVVAIILIIAAIAIPNLLRAKIAGNEASAVGSLHTINTACANYSTTFNGTFPPSLAAMGPSSAPTSTAADLLDAVVASGTKSGYTFSYTPGAAGPTGVISTYSITATPVNFGITGQRGFYTDQSLVIRYSTSGSATSSNSPIG